MMTTNTLITAAAGLAIGFVVFNDLGLGIVIGIVLGGAVYAASHR